MTPTLFSNLEAYPWSTDFEYQSGLAAILGKTSVTTSPVPQCIPADLTNRDLHLRARCFYFARKFPSQCGPEGVDFDAYAAWRAQQPQSELTTLELTNPTPPPSSAPSSENNTPEKPKPVQTQPSSSQAQPNGTPTKSRDPYFSRSDSQASPIAWQQSSLARAPVPPAQPSQAPRQPGDEPPPSASFEEIKRLVERGEPIPGIQEIPNTVLVGQGSEPTLPKRKKPWERDDLDPLETSGIAIGGGLDDLLREETDAARGA